MRPALRLAGDAPPRPSRLLDGPARYRSADRRRVGGPHCDDLAQHQARYGRLPGRLGPAGTDLIEVLAAARLTGRGGAHFPAAAKWRTVLAAGGNGYVVANGAEGEPLSAKDTALLQHRPHLVLDGLAAAAEALAAVGGVVWLHQNAPDTWRAVSRALAERRAAGLVEPPVHLLAGPDHYLTGESSAVLNGIAGGPAVPSFNRVPAAHAGLHGRPTLVQNVETLARVALLARHGPRGEQPGPMVTVVAGGLLTVYEPPPHVTLAGLLLAAGIPGRRSRPPQAVLLGGYGGSWASWELVAAHQVGHLDGRRASPSSRGTEAHRREPVPSLGTGIVAPLPPDTCGLAETAAILDYLARSSARQCGPCVFGTRDLADTMTRVAAGRSRRSDLHRIRRLTDEIDGRGACGLPDGAARLAATALRVFEADAHQHLRRNRCLHPGNRPVLPETRR